MIRTLKELFKRRANRRFDRRDTAQGDKGRNASGEQVKDAARYVSERFSHAITQLSER